MHVLIVVGKYGVTELVIVVHHALSCLLELLHEVIILRKSWCCLQAKQQYHAKCWIYSFHELFFYVVHYKDRYLVQRYYFFLYGQTKFIKKTLHPPLFFGIESLMVRFLEVTWSNYVLDLSYCHYYAIFIFVLYFVVGCKVTKNF